MLIQARLSIIYQPWGSANFFEGIKGSSGAGGGGRGGGRSTGKHILG